MIDIFGRPLRDLRISVTDRCNFRCTYCMPKAIFGAGYRFLPRSRLLSYEEIARLARLFAKRGCRKLRLTGGEPLLRKDLERLIAELAAIPGIEDISLTTNGSLLTSAKARALQEAGLNRMTISLDALDDATFKSINDVDFSVARVLKSIDHAAAAGLAPVKINMVVKRHVNEHAVLPMAARFRGTGHIVRFIEYMDVGNANGWRLDDVVSAHEITTAIGRKWPVEPVQANYRGEVAKRWRYRDGAGEIGAIASVTQPFCGGCTRARLSSEGTLYTCLFGGHGHDLRGLLRKGATDEYISRIIAGIWSRRLDRYSELRSAAADVGEEMSKVEMSYIGG
jgi:cyclic pyranopterin phosphate synthase